MIKFDQTNNYCIMAKKTFQVGRDAGTGKFIKVKEAQRRKKTAVVETIKVGTRKKK